MRKVQTNTWFFLLPWKKLHVGEGHADRDLQHKTPESISLAHGALGSVEELVWGSRCWSASKDGP